MKRFMMMMVCGTVSLSLVACESKPAASDNTDEQASSQPPEETTETTKDIPEVKEPAAAQKLEAPVDKVMAKVGEPAPDFTLTDQAGNEVKLSQFKGKPVVLEWTEKSCPYVVRHYTAKTMPGVIKQAGGTDSVVWLAIDSSHFAKAEEVAEWKKEQGFEYPVLLDAEGKVGAMYNAKNTPHMFVVDKEGVLRYSGAIDDNPRGSKKPEEITNYVSEALKSLKEGKPVENAETKPYGCGVKYKS